MRSQARAERGSYPLIGLDPADVREALAAIHTRGPDDWAAGWSGAANRHIADAAAYPARADAGRLRAWRLQHFAGRPVPSSPGKRAAYVRALDAYARHAATLDPKLEVARFPFGGREIVGCLRLPGPCPWCWTSAASTAARKRWPKRRTVSRRTASATLCILGIDTLSASCT